MTLGREATDLLDTLPFELRADVRAYLTAVIDSIDDIFGDAHVGLTPERRSAFLYLVTLRKIWFAVDSTYLSVRESIRIVGRGGVAEIAIGTARFGRRTSDYLALADLRNRLMGRLQQEEMYELVAFASLSELAEQAAREHA